ncbi:MAG TPA: DUF5329 family protein [Planctomycetia bacterium]|nr:DUF5329 family protein [Planctomycetia bacterium]
MPALSLALALGLFVVAPDAESEKKKIEGLIKHVEDLKDAKFIRNDVEYDPKTAATFLRRKLSSAKGDVKTAANFIEKLATKSSTTGKPYKIKFSDGKESPSGDYLKAELKKLETPTPDKNAPDA